MVWCDVVWFWCRPTLNGDLAEGAGVAGGAGGEAHVLSRVVRRHVVQDQRARAVGVLDDDVVRVCLHRAAILVWGMTINNKKAKYVM